MSQQSHPQSDHPQLLILTWIYLCILLASGQSTDPSSTIDQVCISGSWRDINGIYKYHSWNPTASGPVYYNSELNRYLYPWIYSSTDKRYLVHWDPSTSTRYSHCFIPSSSTEINPDDCYNQNGQLWQSTNNTNLDFYVDGSLRLVNCNDICVSGSDKSHSNGIYKWHHFDSTRNSSIYYCSKCKQFLFGVVDDNNNYQWMIGSDYTNSISSTNNVRCNLTGIIRPYSFDLNDCDKWEVFYEENVDWIIDDDMMVDKCTADQLWLATDIRSFEISTMKFGFTTPISSKTGCCSTTSATITITIFLGTIKYQCQVQPDSFGTYYFCDISDTLSISECITNTTSYGIQIDNDDGDTVEIDQIIIRDSLNNTFIIEYFCFEIFTAEMIVNQERFLINEQCLDIFAMDNDQSYPFIYIPLTQMNISYVYPMNGTAECKLCSKDILTPFYGGGGGLRVGNPNQGKINGISSWGTITASGYTNSLWAVQWTSTELVSSVIYNSRSYANCDPFELAEDDYINGYRVIHDDSIVYGLTLYTFKNNSYECSASGLDISNYDDSGIIIYDDYYLNGFYMYTGDAMDAISFQFSPISNESYICSESYKYVLIENKYSWENANDFCVSQYNTTLATIITDSDLQIALYLKHNIHTQSDSETLWIGLTDQYNESQWQWIDGKSCDYMSNGLCSDDTHWSFGEPNNYEGNENYGSIWGYDSFNDDGSNEQFMALCNNPLYTEKRLNPTLSPTDRPTDINTTDTLSVNSNNIMIENHQNIDAWWIAFYLLKVDLSCGGAIINVEISDNNYYNNSWISFDPEGLIYDQYSFLHQGLPFTAPLSVRITRNDSNTNETITGYNVISELIGYMKYDFGSNFCGDTTSSVLRNNSMVISAAYFQYGVVILFSMIAFAGYIDAKFIRRNDFFHVMAIIKAMLEFSDMLSDIFFAIHVFHQYQLDTEDSMKFLFISVSSILCVVITVIISLYQLQRASSKYWLNENNTRQWLLTNGKYLYLGSIILGSSFTSVNIFTSSLFALNIFDIGLNKKHILSWNTKRIYSVILFENFPQLLLAIWYTLILGDLTYIPAVQMTFSVISIITTVMAICLQRKIYRTQDFVDITIDITGQCVTDNLKICQRKIYKIKKYISQSVLGVNKDSVDVERPTVIPNGVQIRIHISYIHESANINPADNYYDLLNDAKEKGNLVEKIQSEWKLSSVPSIGDIECSFVKSKEKKQFSIMAKKRQIGSENEGLRLEDTTIMKQRSTEMLETIQIKT